MKRYRFPFERVRTVRGRVEDRALAALAEAQRAELARRDDLLAARERLAGASGPGPADVAAFVALRQLAAWRAGAARQAEHDVAAATTAAEERRQSYLAARRERMVLDRLDERLRGTHAQQVQAAEQRVLDDLAGARAGGPR